MGFTSRIKSFDWQQLNCKETRVFPKLNLLTNYSRLVLCMQIIMPCIEKPGTVSACRERQYCSTMRLSLLCCRIWLKPATKIVRRLSNLIQLAIDRPWTNFYIYISSMKHSVSKKSVLTRWSFSSRSINVAPKMSFAVAFLHLPILFSKDSRITCCKKAFLIPVQRFYLIWYKNLVSASAPLNATSALIREKNFFLHFFSRVNVFILLFFCLWNISFGTKFLFVERIV